MLSVKMDGRLCEKERQMGGQRTGRSHDRSPSLYNDTLHCAINKSMANTCSLSLLMEILARRYFAATASCIDKSGLKLNFLTAINKRAGRQMLKEVKQRGKDGTCFTISPQGETKISTCPGPQ